MLAEEPPAHRGGAQDAFGTRRQSVEPGGQDLLHGGRDARYHARLDDHPTILLEQHVRLPQATDDLLDEKRIAARPRQDGLGQCVVDGHAENRLHERAGGCVAECVEGDALGFPDRGPGGAARRQEQTTARLDVTRQLSQHIATG